MNRRQFAKLSAIGSIGTLLFGCNAKTGFPFKKNQVIACFGDSITFGGGNGYVEMNIQVRGHIFLKGWMKS